MALKINKKVTDNGDLSRSGGCYIQIKPYVPYKAKDVPVDIGIWPTKASFNNSKEQPLIFNLIEVKNSYILDSDFSGSSYEGKNILNKFLMWINEAVKAKILADNPSWTSADVEIVDIPKI